MSFFILCSLLPDLLQTHKLTFTYFCYLYGFMKSVLQTCWPNRTSKLFFILLYFFFNIYPEKYCTNIQVHELPGKFCIPREWNSMGANVTERLYKFPLQCFLCKGSRLAPRLSLTAAGVKSQDWVFQLVFSELKDLERASSRALVVAI